MAGEKKKASQRGATGAPEGAAGSATEPPPPRKKLHPGKAENFKKVDPKRRIERMLAAKKAVTDQLKADFLREYTRLRSLTAACKAANVAWSSIYEWRKDDPAFAEGWLACERQQVADLEASAMARAISGVRRPAIHNGKIVMINQTIGPDGEPIQGTGQPLMLTDFETALTIFMLKKRKPEIYSDQSNAQGGLTPDEFASKAREAMAVARSMMTGIGGVDGASVDVSISIPVQGVGGSQGQGSAAGAFGGDGDLQDVSAVQSIQGAKATGESEG